MKYFKHYCHAGSNLDLAALIHKYGWEWYGRYWRIVEMVGEQVSKNNLSFSLTTNSGEPVSVEWLASELGTNVGRLIDVCRQMAFDKLIDTDDWNNKNLISIPKMRELSDRYIASLCSNCVVTSPIYKEEDKDKEETTDGTYSEFIRRAAKYFYEERKRMFPTLTPKTLDSVYREWMSALEMLQRIDKHTEDEIRLVIAFVLQDDFWRKQIRSLPKLRKSDSQGSSYFSLMLEKAKEKNFKITKKNEPKSIMKQQIEEFHKSEKAKTLLKQLQDTPQKPQQ